MIQENAQDFEKGYQHLKQTIKEEQVMSLYYSIKNAMHLEQVLPLKG